MEGLLILAIVECMLGNAISRVMMLFIKTKPVPLDAIDMRNSARYINNYSPIPRPAAQAGDARMAGARIRK